MKATTGWRGPWRSRSVVGYLPRGRTTAPGSETCCPWQECAQRLALTDWDRLQALELMGERRRAVDLNPELAQGHVNLGVVYFKLGQTNAALMEYQEGLRMKPDSPSAHINLGHLLSQQGQLTQAAEHYAAAVHSAPENPIAHFNLANALRTQGRAAE